MNSPFVMVPSNEQTHENQRNTDIDLHVDNLNEHIIQKSEHASLPDLSELSGFDEDFEEEIKRGSENLKESIYYTEDEELYMSISEDGEILDTENFHNFNTSSEDHKVVGGDTSSILDKGDEVGSDINKLSRKESELELRNTEAEREIEAERNERKHNLVRETDQLNVEANIVEEKTSQEKPKMSGVGFLGRSKIATKEIDNESKGGVDDERKEVKNSESSGKEESKVEDKKNRLDKIKINVEDAQNKKHIKAIQSSEHKSKEGNQVQTLSSITSSTSITTVTANATRSASLGASNSTDRTNVYTNNTFLTVGTDNPEKVESSPKKITPESVGSMGNITLLDSGSNSKSKPKSLKKAASHSGKDKSKRKSNKMEETTLKKVSKEVNKGEGSEFSKPGRLGSSRGDLPKSEKFKQNKDLKLSSIENEKSETDFKDRYQCLNLNIGILDPLSHTCPVSLGLEKLKRMRGRTEKEDEKQKNRSIQKTKLLENSKIDMKNFYHPIWLEFSKTFNNICTKFESNGDLSSKKVPIKDTGVSKNSLSNNVNNNVTTSTTTKTSKTKKSEVLSEPTKIPDTRNLASTEKQNSTKHGSASVRPEQSNDTKREYKQKSESIISWGIVLRVMDIITIPDTYIQRAVTSLLKFNIYIYKLYTNIYKRRILRKVQWILWRIHIVNKSQIIMDKHFLGAYTVFGSLLSILLLLIITSFHRRLCIGISENSLEETETIKKLGLVGGKIKMLNSHISNSDRGIERTVFSEDPSSICHKIMESRSLVSNIPSNIDHSENRTDFNELTSIKDLTEKLEENNEILLHLSNGLSKCAQSLTI